MENTTAPAASQLAARAEYIRSQMPAQGLFAEQNWRLALTPFPLGKALANDLDKLGRVLLQFYRAVNLLYRKSGEGKQPAWIARWLDLGKPESLLNWQRHPAFKNEMPRVIRPDILLTENGFQITELDSVPGGIGLTAWLNQVYTQAPSHAEPMAGVIGGSAGMLNGFAAIFGETKQVHLVVSQESSGYLPEMQWLAGRLGAERFATREPSFANFQAGDAVYRFFELFDLANVPGAQTAFTMAAEKQLRLTPPPKPLFEEKMLFALLWNRNLRDYWRQELGESFLHRLQQIIPYTWVMDPAPLPPHGAIPELNLTDWAQLKNLSQRERELILKVSGYSPDAWGARGVYLGSDLSQAEWSAAVDKALNGFAQSPYVLQRFHKPRLVESAYYDFARRQVIPMSGRVRLCPYYFVVGEGDAARTQLGGVLATICPADKKIIHGMRDAIMAPCSP